MKFKLDRRPYDSNQIMFNKVTIDIKPGITVLVGCNGSGKSTLIKQMIMQLDREHGLYMHYDNIEDGGKNTAARHLGDINGAGLFGLISSSSEGEGIYYNFGEFVAKIHGYLKKNQRAEHEEFFIFADAIDSGLSIDNVNQFTDLFNLIISEVKRKYNIDVYIIISANGYEFVRDNECFDVVKGIYRVFRSYEAYRNFILRSAKYKIKREEDYDRRVEARENRKDT